VKPDRERARRIDRTEALAWRREETAIDAEGVAIEEFEGALAFATPGHPNTLFNRTIGLGAEHAVLVDVIVAWYRKRNIPPRLDVSPARRDPALVKALAAAGLVPGGFPFFSRRILAGSPEPSPDPVPGVDVSRLVPGEEDEFHAVARGAWRMPDGEAERRRRRLTLTIGREDIRHYLARVDGRVAGVAMLYVIDGTGYFGLAATREEFRGRGVHTAMIRHRAIDARERGCDLLTALVAPDTASQRNLVREGLRVVGDRETWLPPDWTSHPFFASAG
jgi:hypothetical protein